MMPLLWAGQRWQDRRKKKRDLLEAYGDEESASPPGWSGDEERAVRAEDCIGFYQHFFPGPDLEVDEGAAGCGGAAGIDFQEEFFSGSDPTFVIFEDLLGMLGDEGVALGLEYFFEAFLEGGEGFRDIRGGDALNGCASGAGKDEATPGDVLWGFRLRGDRWNGERAEEGEIGASSKHPGYGLGRLRCG